MGRLHSVLDRDQLDTWCERGIFALILAILVYSPLATGAIRPRDFVVVEWLTVAVLALWLPRFWLNPKHRLLWPPICWAVIAFMAYAGYRYLTADVEFLARQEVLKVIIYGTLFLAILHNLHRLETIQTVALALLGLATLIALYGIVQFLVPSDRVWHFLRPLAYYKRGSGTFINPNHFAGYLEMLLPLAIAYTLAGRFNHITKIFLGYASIVIFIGIMVSVSRGSWIATGLTLPVLFIWLMSIRDYRFKAAIILAAYAALATIFVLRAELSLNRRDSLARLTAGDGLRFRIWQPAVRIWQDHFWLGAGPAHFDYRFRQYRPIGPYPDQMQIRPDRVHNDYLNTLADWGLIGALLMASAWVLFYWDVIRGWKFIQRSPNDLAAKRSNKASFVIGGALGLLAILLHSVTDYNMHIPANAILAVTLMALVSAHFRYTTERYWHTVRWPLKIPVTLALLAIGIPLTAETLRRTRECHWLNKAYREPYYSVAQLDALQRAHKIEPQNFETTYLIGEGYRMHSWLGGDDYKQLAETAMIWLKRSMELNRYDPYPVIRYGMCLDWVGKHEAAESYFKKALEVDPNSYYIRAHMGWHYVQVEDWAEAKRWFEKSLSLYWTDNKIASTYLEMVNRKLAENPRGGQGSAASASK